MLKIKEKCVGNYAVIHIKKLHCALIGICQKKTFIVTLSRRTSEFHLWLNVIYILNIEMSLPKRCIFVYLNGTKYISIENKAFVLNKNVNFHLPGVRRKKWSSALKTSYSRILLWLYLFWSIWCRAIAKRSSSSLKRIRKGEDLRNIAQTLIELQSVETSTPSLMNKHIITCKNIWLFKTNQLTKRQDVVKIIRRQKSRFKTLMMTLFDHKHVIHI